MPRKRWWFDDCILFNRLPAYFLFCIINNCEFNLPLDRSPVFGHFSTTLLGLPTIRAFRVQGTFVDFYNRFQDDHTKAWFSFISSAAWLSFRLEILSTLFITFVVFVSIALRDSLGLTAGQVGLMLSYTINVTGVFQQCVRQSTEVENHMTSVERVLEYCELEPEAPPETDVKPPLEWPHRGSIRFKNMSFSYAKGLPNVLDDVTCHIKSTEKVRVHFPLDTIVILYLFFLLRYCLCVWCILWLYPDIGNLCHCGDSDRDLIGQIFCMLWSSIPSLHLSNKQMQVWPKIPGKLIKRLGKMTDTRGLRSLIFWSNVLAFMYSVTVEVNINPQVAQVTVPKDAYLKWCNVCLDLERDRFRKR